MLEIYPAIALNLVIFALLGWLYSLFTNKVTHVDSMWSLFFLVAYLTGLCYLDEISNVQLATLVALVIWSLRLSIHLTIRNWAKVEYIRYQHIRANNEPFFKWKSSYIIFLFQALLALLIALPLVSISQQAISYDVFTKIGLALFAVGFLIELLADRQLQTFLKSNKTHGVLNTGLWRYSRHPNYFGVCLILWGFYIIAMPSSSIFILISPILMTILLVKISGADLMESTITERRPGYKAYVNSTSKFIPWPPKN